jgi:hypothetical protein
MSVRPSHATVRLSVDGFSWNLIFDGFFFRKGVEKMLVALQSANNNRYFTWRPTDIHFWKYTAQFFVEWNILQTKVVEKIKTHILCSVTFFRKSRRLWDNVEKYGRAGQATGGNIIWRMRFACWITKATNTHSEYVILTSFPLQQRLHDCTSMSRYTCILMLLRWISSFSGLEVT